MSVDQASISDPRSLPLRIAHDRLESFTRETNSLAGRPGDRVQGRDCEALLQLGIDAFDWLMRADTSLRRAVYRGEQDYDPSVDEEITRLLQRWLVPGECAESLAVNQTRTGLEVTNLEAFLRCVREVRGMLTPDGEFFKSDELVRLRDEALDAHHQGQTSEHGAG